jgi:hypothetical protein
MVKERSEDCIMRNYRNAVGQHESYAEDSSPNEIWKGGHDIEFLFGPLMRLSPQPSATLPPIRTNIIEVQLALRDSAPRAVTLADAVAKVKSSGLDLSYLSRRTT